MDRDQRAWEALLLEAAKRGARVIDKDKSLLMTVLYYVTFMFLWNPKFRTDFATAALGRIWIPRSWWGKETGWRVLAHEIVHIDQAARGSLWHTLAYGFPQILSPLGLLGFLGLAWWPLYFLFLLIPLFFLPLFPAWGRIDREMEAWVVSVAVYHHVLRAQGIVIREGAAPYYVTLLLSGPYFWAGGVLRGRLRAKLLAELNQRADDSASWPEVTRVALAAWDGGTR